MSVTAALILLLLGINERMYNSQYLGHTCLEKQRLSVDCSADKPARKS
jgi:hypothetical protein